MLREHVVELAVAILRYELSFLLPSQWLKCPRSHGQFCGPAPSYGDRQGAEGTKGASAVARLRVHTYTSSEAK